MYRFMVFHLEQENRSGILSVLSHLVSDAWTFGLMANQVEATCYKLAGEEDVILLEGNYADFGALHSLFRTIFLWGKPGYFHNDYRI